jgi:hydroxymethylpyrimidine/phosphomethylpyrimidine kinase
MSANRPFVLSVAGFDPSAGAGVLADIKTFEQHQVYGLAICTGITLQTENEFHSMEWRKIETIIYELRTILKKYLVKAIKFGIVPSFEFLDTLVSEVKKINDEISIIVDPVLRSSTGFDFSFTIENSALENLLEKITVFTPNYAELQSLSNGTEINVILNNFSKHASVLLKGGHNSEKAGTDILYYEAEVKEIPPINKKIFSKHGSGCVLSAAITANLALGYSVERSCVEAKQYTENFLLSSETLLGYHTIK